MNATQSDTIMKENNQTAISCYMDIPKYFKLFIQIVRETSFGGKGLVRETSVCPRNVRYPHLSLYFQA